ncbi:hypothetical protein DOY81_007911 [Sarcophaga bullata]|nr:hypothetical protein DOY81_007911 [Sarcophaga bullata]
MLINIIFIFIEKLNQPSTKIIPPPTNQPTNHHKNISIKSNQIN